MHEYAEELDGPRLPDVVESFFARERAWHRFLRGAELVNAEGALERLRCGTER